MRATEDSLILKNQRGNDLTVTSQTTVPPHLGAKKPSSERGSVAERGPEVPSNDDLPMLPRSVWKQTQHTQRPDPRRGQQTLNPLRVPAINIVGEVPKREGTSQSSGNQFVPTAEPTQIQSSEEDFVNESNEESHQYLPEHGITESSVPRAKNPLSPETLQPSSKKGRSYTGKSLTRVCVCS